MKNLFSEYYAISSQEYDRIWENALIVFDTNILLDLYRYSEDSSSDFMSAMTSYEARLWLPYQVAWEFQRNRLSTISSQVVAYNQLSSKLESEITKALENVANWKEAQYKGHPYIKLESIERTIQKSKEIVKKKLQKLEPEHPISIDNDHIFDKITSLYNDKVGDNYNEEQYNKLFIEAKKRYKEKTPPGFCDEDDKKGQIEQILYGDFILWKQIIDKSKSDKKDIIFVSNDEKEDWRLKCHGKTIGVRKELIREFENATGQKILIYNRKLFLEYAKKNNVKVRQKTINEIEKIEAADIAVFREKTRDALLAARRAIEEQYRIYDYSRIIEEAKRLYYPIEDLRKIRLNNHFEELRKTIEAAGGIGEVQRRAQEIQTLVSAGIQCKKEDNSICEDLEEKKDKDTE